MKRIIHSRDGLAKAHLKGFFRDGGVQGISDGPQWTRGDWRKVSRYIYKNWPPKDTDKRKAFEVGVEV